MLNMADTRQTLKMMLPHSSLPGTSPFFNTPTFKYFMCFDIHKSDKVRYYYPNFHMRKRRSTN